MAEISFPRGNVQKPKIKQVATPVYGAAVHSKEQPKKVKYTLKEIIEHKKRKTANQSTELQAQNAKLLNVHSLEVGMLIMGCVRNIGKDYLLISLPGRITGRATVNEISDAYTKEQSNGKAKPLQTLFTAGDLVCCRVVSKSVTADEYHVNLSLNPKEVNTHLRSHQICRGFALIGSIKAIEDHGYIIDTGISNSSAFLSLKNAKRKTASVGELVVGCVEKIVSAKEQPTFMLKESSYKTPEPLMLEEPNMDLLFPCSVVEFTVTDHIADGLKGHLFDGLFENVYINAQQLQNTAHKITNYEIGSTCQARILYVTNLSKHIHCTLNLEKIKTNAEFSDVIGIVVKDAKVLKTTQRCVFFQWKNEQNETLNGVMNVSESSDSVADKYPVKSKHEIEIRDYYLLDHIYKVGLVTEDKWKRIGNVNAMEVGNVVEGIVTMALNLGGYGLKIGRVHGYLHEIDLKPSVFYKKGDKVTVKIIAIDYQKNSVQVTNRPEYFTPYAELLASANNLKCGQIFTGVLYKDLPTLYLVRFANKVMGGLMKDVVHDEQVFKKLKVGRIFEFKIENIAPDGKIRVVVATDEEKRAALAASGSDVTKLDSKNKLNKFIGTEMQGIVHKVGAQSLSIEIPHLSLKGTIGRLFLSNFDDLCDTKLKLYQQMDKVDCVCVGAQLFSVRDLDFYKANPNKLFSNTFEGEVLKSSIIKVSAETLELFCPIQDVKLNLKTTLQQILQIPKFEKDLTDDSLVGFGLDQVIYVRVDAKQRENKQLVVSANLFDVWMGSETITIDICIKYLEEIEWIRQRFIKMGEPLAELTIGDVVEAEITDIIENEAKKVLLKLSPNDIDAVIENFDSSADLPSFDIGGTIKCTVIWIDYAQQLVYLTSDKKVSKHIRRHQKAAASQVTEVDNTISEQLHFSKLLFKNKDIMIFYSKSIESKLPFVIVPTRFHYNDFYRRLQRYSQTTDDDIELGGQPIKILKTANNLNYGLFAKALEFCKYVQKKSAKIRQELKQVVNNEENSDEIVEATLSTGYFKGPLNPNKRKLKEGQKSPKKVKQNKKLKLDDTKKKSKSVGKEEAIAKAKKFVQKVIKPTLKSPVQAKANKSKFQKSVKTDIVKKKKKKTQTIEQLDGACDLDLFTLQLDGASDLCLFSTQMDGMPGGMQKKRKNKAVYSSKNKPIQKQVAKTKEQSLKTMPGAENFWSATTNAAKRKADESASSEDEEEEDSSAQDPAKKLKLSKKERLDMVKAEEERLTKIENNFADATAEPHSPDHFDRLLLGAPNNSLMWIKYMCFHMEAAEIEKARNVAHRAMKTINFREEQEILNVWLALLNLEIRYGNEGTWNLVLEEALVRNNPFKVYSKAVEILLSVDKKEELDGILQKMLKKFKQIPDMWINVATAYFEMGLVEKVKQLLTKALVCLPVKEHIQMIVRFAFLNNKYGQKDQAHVLFEQIVTSYPKRVDIWSQYIDMLIKDKLVDAARQILDRAVSQKLPMKKMKTLFTKFVQFEEKYGTAANVHSVKQLAADYVKRVSSQNDEDV